MPRVPLLALAGPLALVAAWTAPSPAWARGLSAECRSNPYLPRAKDQYERLEFDPSARTLQRAVEHSRNCRRDLAEIYRLKGFIDAINAERERCQRAFEILLALEPEYVLPPSVPPKIRSCFEDAERVPEDRRRLEIGYVPPSEVPPNAPVAMAVEVQDPLRLVDQVQVWFRRAGVEVYTAVSARADDTVSVVIPALSLPPSEEGYEMEFFVRAVDRWEGTLAEAGSPRRPMGFRVAAGGTGGSVVSEWWFWTILAGAAVAAGAIGFAATQGDPDRIELGLVDGGTLP